MVLSQAWWHMPAILGVLSMRLSNFKRYFDQNTKCLLEHRKRTKTVYRIKKQHVTGLEGGEPDQIQPKHRKECVCCLQLYKL